jgi:hypothetical protein
VDSDNLRGKHQVAIVAAILLAGAAISAAILIPPRTVITPASFGYIQTDRWTGHTVACSVETPSEYLGRLEKNLVKTEPNPVYKPEEAWNCLLKKGEERSQECDQFLYTHVDPAIARQQTGSPQVCVELD